MYGLSDHSKPIPLTRLSAELQGSSRYWTCMARPILVDTTRVHKCADPEFSVVDTRTAVSCGTSARAHARGSTPRQTPSSAPPRASRGRAVGERDYSNRGSLH